MTEIVPIERITDKICPIRSQKVIIDHDLAELYGVETKQLKRAVRAGSSCGRGRACTSLGNSFTRAPRTA